MSQLQPPKGVCICGAPMCNTAEARAFIAAREREERARARTNRAAFELYLADRAAGVRLLSPANYVAIAQARAQEVSR